MKNLLSYIGIALMGILLFQACGQTEEEIEYDQEAVQDSLEQVYEAEMEQMRQDSIAQAEADSIAAAEAEPDIEYSDNGEYSVQVESWRSREKAQAQAEEWKERGFDHAFVVEYGDSDVGDLWFRIRIGQFDTIEMATDLKEQLEEDYNVQSWISK
ncbi:MAG: SPOR domain-containing protein [Balneolaceae bacterium]